MSNSLGKQLNLFSMFGFKHLFLKAFFFWQFPLRSWNMSYESTRHLLLKIKAVDISPKSGNEHGKMQN